MSPNLEVSTGGGQIGKDSDEQQGNATSGDIGASEKRRTETGKRAVMMGMSYRQSKRLAKRYREGGAQRAEARKRGAGVEPKEAEEISRTSVAVGGQEVFGGGRRAVRADAGGRALGERRSCGSECADAAAVDVVGRAVESSAEAAVCIASGESGKSMWGNWCRWMEVSTTGWRTRAGRVFDEHGGRRQRRYAGPAGE